MAIDFPASPTNGQTFQSGNNVWTYDGTVWKSSYVPSPSSLTLNYKYADLSKVVPTRYSVMLPMPDNSWLRLYEPAYGDGGIVRMKVFHSMRYTSDLLAINRDVNYGTIVKIVSKRVIEQNIVITDTASAGGTQYPRTNEAFESNRQANFVALTSEGYVLGPLAAKGNSAANTTDYGIEFRKPFDTTNVNNASNKVKDIVTNDSHNPDIIHPAAGDTWAIIDQNDALWMMGENGYGALGIGSTVDSGGIPVRARTGVSTNLRAISQVWIVGYTVLALATDGTWWAAGYGVYGQTGGGRTSNQTYFVQVTELPDPSTKSGVKKVLSSGGDESNNIVILFNNGELWGAGRNNTGALGRGTTTVVSTYVLLTADTVSNVWVTADDGANTIDDVFYITSAGVLKAAGYNAANNLLDGTTTQRTSFVTCNNTTGATVVDMWSIYATDAYDRFFHFAWMSDGKLYSWGYGSSTFNAVHGRSGTAIQTSLTEVQRFWKAGASVVKMIHSDSGSFPGVYAFTSDGEIYLANTGSYGFLPIVLEV
jgi:hypothetical protein